MDMTAYIEAAEFSLYHGSDLALRVLSRMLKIPIAAWNSHFIWVSAPYVSVYECPVLVVMDCVGNFHGTGDKNFIMESQPISAIFPCDISLLKNSNYL